MEPETQQPTEQNNQQTDAQATPVPDEQGLSAGFAMARGSDPTAAEATAAPAQAIEAAPEQNPGETAPAEPAAEALIAGLPESQVRALLANAGEVVQLKEGLRKVFGELGTLKNPQGSPLAKARLEKLRQEYPEVADLLEADLAALPGAAGASAEAVERQIQERVAATVATLRQETAAELDRRMTVIRVENRHKDWATVRDTPEYKLWLNGTDQAYRDKFVSSWDADTVIEGLDKFKKWRDDTATASARKKERLEHAVVTPPRAITAPRSVLPDNAGLSVGFNAARGSRL